VHSEHLNLAA